MCTEFLLVLIYFVILSCINFLLFNLLKSYFKKILILKKFRQIVLKTKQKNLTNFSSLYFLSKDRKKFTKSIENLNSINFPIQDNFLLKNFYKIISQTFLESNEKNYYFKLLKFQIFPD
jgi:hypothetical protein